MAVIVVASELGVLAVVADLKLGTGPPARSVQKRHLTIPIHGARFNGAHRPPSLIVYEGAKITRIRPGRPLACALSRQTSLVVAEFVGTPVQNLAGGRRARRGRGGGAVVALVGRRTWWSPNSVSSRWPACSRWSRT